MISPLPNCQRFFLNRAMPDGLPGTLLFCSLTADISDKKPEGKQSKNTHPRPGYPWYTGNILFAFAVTGQVLRWVSQPSWYYTLPAAGLLVAWIPLSTASYGMAGVGMLTASWLLCRAQHAPERLGYGVLWALMVLLMNMHDVSESVAGLAIALLTLMVCSSAGERVKRFWPRQFFVMFYAVHLAVLGIVVSM